MNIDATVPDRRPRQWALSALLLILLPASGTAPAGASPPGASSKLLALLPGSPDLILSVDYSALRKSDLVADLEERLDALPEPAENYRRFVGETGIDPRQDLDQLVMARRGSSPEGEGEFLVIAQGRFGPGRLLNAIAEKGGTLATAAGGTKIWSSRPEGARQRVVALAQSDDSTLLFGDEREVRRVLEVLRGSRQPERKGTRIRDLIAGVDRKAPIWAVLSSASLARRISGQIGESAPDWKPGGTLSSVDSLRLMVWVGADVDLRLQVEAKDRETAGMLADLVRGALAAGKLSAKDRDPALVKILKNVAVREAETGMEVEARIPASRFKIDRSDSSEE